MGFNLGCAPKKGVATSLASIPRLNAHLSVFNGGTYTLQISCVEKNGSLVVDRTSTRCSGLSAYGNVEPVFG